MSDAIITVGNLGKRYSPRHLSDQRCVAIFSSRERPGPWYPHGEGHRVFRTTIDCEGCGLVECLERGNECINRITTDEVLMACRDFLKSFTQHKPDLAREPLPV